MDRFTKLRECGSYIVSSENIKCDAEGCFGEAIDKLGKFEDFIEDIKADLEDIPKELDQMRPSGREKSPGRPTMDSLGVFGKLHDK